MGVNFAPFPPTTGGFSIHVDEKQHVIELSGYLNGEPLVADTLERALGYAARQDPSGVWTIRSMKCSPMIEGVTAWIKAVQYHLEHATIDYESSQLELTLRHNREYKHRHSIFPPEGT